ncbi:FecR domain-containing protein [Chitinophaga oryzae]|uniref:FecR domain-containing protein n=1 Tax=Chitinophaga oryzae TaxID=2725414 RepID=A0AAE6ZIW0_9BACT|nr:FecR family protein [Chitinophaga oryzae]QJB33821.1 FecR domain-containing protein [Chitinophaga oryzae]QJB40344.1 FecR domain-containing protein [Chitinophaga oryzae]
MPAEKNNEYYRLLLQRWQQRTCSPQEALELMDYLRDDVSGRTLLHEMQAAFRQVKPGDGIHSGEPGDRVRKELLQHIQGAPVTPLSPRRNYSWLKLAAAAAVLLGFAIPAVYFLRKPVATTVAVTAVKAAPAAVTPGGHKAVLTLANGEKIVLDSAAIHQLAQQGNSAVHNQDGQLVYVKTKDANSAPVYNTLTTGPGETYPLVLADGSKIWLNASSSLRFPAAFAGDERRIELSGEAYFEVAHDARRPFRVLVNQVTVDVLGTSFNINSYPDEATINTTLLEGAVKVNSKKESIQLAPGEQSQISPGGHVKKITGVNTAEIIAWKEGYFQFESTDLTTVLRQFAHWYDVEIIYEGRLRPRKFFGMISRSSSLMNVLKMLNANDVNYRLEGKKLIIEGD